ncbi:MAG: siderophore-interacting protein [Mycetocola sp.]
MRVTRAQRLSSSLLRATFSGDDLQHIADDGLDQRIKVLFPIAGVGFTDIGLHDDPPAPVSEWYGRWRTLPDEARNPMRTYTVRNPRPALGEVDIDFVLHGDAGPASAWAMTAAPGDELVIVGPDARSDQSGGIEWKPGAASDVLLAGDETALPAICAILESLPAGIRGQAFIEVPHADDRIPVETASSVALTWLPRDGAPLGERLSSAVKDWVSRSTTPQTTDAAALETESPDEVVWDVPDAEPANSDGDFYAWLAGEAGVITSLRRHLVRDLGIDRRRVAFMGYWRVGRSEN